MKKIPKKLLDEHIEASKAYWNGYQDSNSEQRKRLSLKMETSFAIAEATGLDWMAIQSFVDGILETRGLVPDAENDEIYSALRVLGWEAVDND